MKGLKYLLLFLICMPVMPDLCCMPPVYADEMAIQAADSFDSHVKAILFFICVLVGNRLWHVFINSFEKGSI